MFNRQEGGVLLRGKNYRWYFIEKEGMWQVQDIQNNKLFKVRDSYHTRRDNRIKYFTEEIEKYLKKKKGEGDSNYIIVYSSEYLNGMID